MSSKIDRRRFLRQAVTACAAGSLALQGGQYGKLLHGGQSAPVSAEKEKTKSGELSQGRICDLKVSRLLLGGNLLTHYTHSRDLSYVYDLTAHYNTEEKILETMREAERFGVNTLVVHTVPRVMRTLKKYRSEWGGGIQWIICPTAPVEKGMKAYRKQVKELVDMGVDAVYLWGVRGDQLVAQRRMDRVAEAVDVVKEHGIPSGVGGHDLRVVTECEEHGVNADFYIKTFHHHDYPTAPRPEEIKGPTGEIPGYWCKDPQEVTKVMAKVTKPWIAFKVMAAGAIAPEKAFRYVFEKGADHILAGMFDFEIAQDVHIAKKALSEAKRTRPWRS